MTEGSEEGSTGVADEDAAEGSAAAEEGAGGRAEGSTEGSADGGAGVVAEGSAKGSAGDTAEAAPEGAERHQGVAATIKLFDSGCAWGSSRQGAHTKRAHPDSPRQSPQQSPRISAWTLEGQMQETHSQAEANLIVTGTMDQFPLLPDCSTSREGSLLQFQAEQVQRQASSGQGTVQHPSLAGQGSLVLPQLRGQQSSMRGDLWLAQPWLEPAEQLASPRNKMHQAMEAVRAAERAVEAARIFGPSRS